jgi:hypothetical protein
VLDEPASVSSIFVNFAPYREGGGGGGDLALDMGSLLLGAGLVTASIECCEDIVRLELLRDLLLVVVVLS